MSPYGPSPSQMARRVVLSRADRAALEAAAGALERSGEADAATTVRRLLERARAPVRTGSRRE